MVQLLMMNQNGTGDVCRKENHNNDCHYHAKGDSRDKNYIF